MAETKDSKKKKYRDMAMSYLHKIRLEAGVMIEMLPEETRNKKANDFDKVFKALQKAVIEL